MKSDIIFKTKKRNDYLLDKNKELVIFLPPDLKNAIENPDKDNSQYYTDKVKWMKRYDFFQPLTNKFASVTKGSIDNQLETLEQIVFEVTDLCNLNCTYCGYGELYGNYDLRKKKMMSIDTGKMVLDYFISLWNTSPYKPAPPRRVYLSFYGGEPLLNMPFINEIVNYAKKNCSDYFYFENSMTTNAILLDKYMDFIVENNFSLLLSIDGNFENNSYRLFHSGKGSFEKVYKNIKLLQSRYPEYFAERVNINSVIHNKNNVSDVYNYIKKEFNKKPSVGALNSNGVRKDKIDSFNSIFNVLQQSFNLAENYDELENEMFINIPNKRVLLDFIYTYSGNTFRHYHDLFLIKKIRERRQTGTCVPFEKKLFITVNGKILPCTTVGQNYPLGYVTDSKIEINSEQIEKRYQSIFEKLQKQCETCFNLDCCRECVYFMKSKDGYFVCDKYLNESDFYKHLSFIYTEIEGYPNNYQFIMEKFIID
jgi:uncharacterized protein